MKCFTVQSSSLDSHVGLGSVQLCAHPHTQEGVGPPACEGGCWGRVAEMSLTDGLNHPGIQAAYRDYLRVWAKRAALLRKRIDTRKD